MFVQLDEMLMELTVVRTRMHELQAALHTATETNTTLTRRLADLQISHDKLAESQRVHQSESKCVRSSRFHLNRSLTCAVAKRGREEQLRIKLQRLQTEILRAADSTSYLVDPVRTSGAPSPATAVDGNDLVRTSVLPGASAARILAHSPQRMQLSGGAGVRRQDLDNTLDEELFSSMFSTARR